MSKIISAGILLEHQGEFLLGHPTELTGTTNGWGILKGKIDEGETLIQGALREFKEECSLDILLSPDVFYVPRPFYKYNVSGGKKTVYVFWAIDRSGTTKQRKLSCPSLVIGTNKPEIDDYKWVSVDKAIEMVTESQKDMFRLVKELTQIN